jgi:glycosyltransferase involved in cell wall biosynthesis
MMAKVAILGTRGIPARYGGFETFADRLAIGLTEHGYDVTVYCEEEKIPGIENYRGVKLRYISSLSLGPLQTILYDLLCLWDARRRFDVVYMLGYGAAPFCLIPRLWGTEVWINPDGLEWARAKWGSFAKLYFRIMERCALVLANRIVADAEAIQSSLVDRHGAIPSCTVIPYGCEVIGTPPPIDLLLEWNLTPDSYSLVVCRLEPENHVMEILEAYRRSDSKRQLIVVGNDSAETEYVHQLNEVKDSRIRMIGTVYDQAKLSCLRYHCYAYYHGHSVGGTNPSLLEAMGCGNLIIAHDNPFNRETLGSCGLFFTDTEKLVQMVNLIEWAEYLRSRLRPEARLRARACYYWPDIISRYVDLLEQTAAEDNKVK